MPWRTKSTEPRRRHGHCWRQCRKSRSAHRPALQAPPPSSCSQPKTRSNRKGHTTPVALGRFMFNIPSSIPQADEEEQIVMATTTRQKWAERRHTAEDLSNQNIVRISRLTAWVIRHQTSSEHAPQSKDSPDFIKAHHCRRAAQCLVRARRQSFRAASMSGAPASRRGAPVLNIGFTNYGKLEGITADDIVRRRWRSAGTFAKDY